MTELSLAMYISKDISLTDPMPKYDHLHHNLSFDILGLYLGLYLDSNLGSDTNLWRPRL